MPWAMHILWDVWYKHRSVYISVALTVLPPPSDFCPQVDFRREDLNQGDWDKIATMLTMEGMRPSLSANQGSRVNPKKSPKIIRHM